MQKFYASCIRFSNRLMAGEGNEGEDKGNQDQESDSDKEQDSKNKDKSEQDSDEDKKRSYTYDEVKSLRDENAAARVKNKKIDDELKTLKARFKEIEDKDKTEVQKLQERVLELEKTNVTLSSESRLAKGIAAAVKYDSIDPESVAKLLDYDSDVEIESQVKSFVKSKPYLFKKNGDIDGGKGGDRGRDKSGKIDFNRYIRGEVR